MLSWPHPPAAHPAPLQLMYFTSFVILLLSNLPATAGTLFSKAPQGEEGEPTPAKKKYPPNTPRPSCRELKKLKDEGKGPRAAEGKPRLVSTAQKEQLPTKQGQEPASVFTFSNVDVSLFERKQLGKRRVRAPQKPPQVPLAPAIQEDESFASTRLAPLVIEEEES